MNNRIQLFDVVALVADKPGKGLRRGQVGTVVEVLAPDAFEIEFADQDGRAYALAALEGPDLIVLHFEAMHATG